MRARAADAVVVASLLAGACGGEGEAGFARGALVWSDEFDGAAGALPDPARWSYDLGGGGWGNGELQTYTNRPENAALDGAGHLVITARREALDGAGYTSARLHTRGKLERAYGRYEARLQLPRGKGLWPAFWLLGTNGRWPDCGEIDVMESRGASPGTVTGSLHGPGYSGGSSITELYRLGDGTTFADGFHVFAIEWRSREVRFLVDDVVYQSVSAAKLPGGAAWVFDHAFYLLLNVAVGGSFGGPPNETTPFPQTMLVDWVRVYADASAP
jgi:beta-glucanase (GH16 family)